MTDPTTDPTVTGTTTASSADGVSIVVAGEWTWEADPVPGISLLAIEPVRAEGGFRANVVVTRDTIAPDVALRDWQLAAEAAQDRELTAYRLLDLEHLELAGRPGVRRLACHVADRVPVTLVQWAAVAEQRGVTVSATCSTMAYPVLAGLFETMAHSLRVDRWRTAGTGA